MSFRDKFPLVDYDELGARQQEVFNFARCAARLARHGFACEWLSADHSGADFLAYHMPSGRVLSVQLKGRFTLAEKYRRKNLWIAFPHGDGFVIMKHDKLYEAYHRYNPGFVEQSHWKTKGERHMASVPAAILPVVEPWLI